MTRLYLVWHDACAGPVSWDGDAYRLNPQLWLVRSELSRSRLYHAIKWQLPPGVALMVAPLHDQPEGWPKFKAMEAGALAWLRGQSR